MPEGVRLADFDMMVCQVSVLMKWGLLVLGLGSISLLPQAQSLDPAVTVLDGPTPARVQPAAGPNGAPSDAIVLFNGQSLDEWQAVGGGEPQWRVAKGVATVVAGAKNIQTKRRFGDVQLHVEWRSPSPRVHAKNLRSKTASKIRDLVAERLGMHQFMANSGIFLQERYEVQVLETYGETTYVNGQAGAIYKQHIPLVNAARPPGEWQEYDIIFQAPRFGKQGAVVVPARLTVLLNGVLIQNHVALWGPTEFVGVPNYQAHGDAPILLQSHAAVSQISYRNIWVREL